jgi:hypothetical protein
MDSQADGLRAAWILGWLMGLEPTTTGITIRPHFQALARLCGQFMGIDGVNMA